MRKENIGKFMSVKDLTTYEVLKDEDLKGIKAKGKLLKHKKSGARVLLVENDDNNKVFSIAFRTPPSDSTGVPHIMEHSVLCGSKNFPAKDPFVELVKGCLLYTSTPPTGVILHFAPVLLAFAAAFGGCLVFFRRKRI